MDDITNRLKIKKQNKDKNYLYFRLLINKKIENLDE